MTTAVAERSYSRFLVPAIGIGLVLVFSLLFVLDRHVYHALLAAWMLAPFPHPFIDWQYVPAAAECWSRGIDVYVATPCYDVGPTFKNSYSPLWLRLDFLPGDPASVAAFGIGWALLFWASQAYVPAPRTRPELRFTLLVALSSLTAFALERGNVDLIMFLLAMSGAYLWTRSLPFRLCAYAIFLLAGLLKFYPLVLLLLVIRERPRVFLPVAAVSTVILAAAVFEFRGELQAASHNIPKGPYFTDLFGSVNLPFGLPVLVSYIASKLGAPSQAAAAFTWISIPIYCVLLLGAVLGASMLAFRAGLQRAVASIPQRHRALLLVGSLLLCGCFFAGQSVGYRGIFLIMLLPGLFQLRNILPPDGSRFIQAALYGIVFVSWVLTIEFMSKGLGLTRGYSLELDGFGLLHWMVHEACWWLIVTLMLAVVMSFASTSSMVEWISVSVTRTRVSQVS